MIPPSFEYAAPKTIPEAVTLLGSNPDAKVIAGGHSLLPMMKIRLSSPAMLIDINRISGLSYIREDGRWLRLGALTREADLDYSQLIQQKYPLLADTTRMIADPLVRNLATVGGNLAHADPANDHPATMLAYGAEIVASGPGGDRVIPIDKFFLGPFTPDLAHDEILTEIRIPAWKPLSGGAYFKVERKVGDFATAAVAAQLTLDRSGKCEYVGIGLTNVGLTALKATAAEAALRGKPPDEANIKAAAQLAADAAQPNGDQRGSEEYKRALVKTLTVRALRKTVERAKGGSA
jgi:carbon-monoxide dehydrogenase medium subunit